MSKIEIGLGALHIKASVIAQGLALAGSSHDAPPTMSSGGPPSTRRRYGLTRTW